VIPSDFSLPTSAADTSKPGLFWNVSEVLASEPNQLSWAESQLAGIQGQNYADKNAVGEDASGPATPGKDQNAPISFIIPKSINFSIVDGDMTHGSTNIIGITQENQMPGLPGTGGNNGTDNIAAEALTYLSLPAGTNSMGVRSDDGFRVVIGGAAPLDVYSTQATAVGQFDGGRGAGDTLFKFVIQKAGLYSARLLYENGGGDASVQWYTVRDDGKFVLVNDVANGGVAAYRAVTTQGAAYASSIIPFPNSTGASPQPTLSVVLQDGATALDTNKIGLSFNGSAVKPSISRSGSQTTVNYTPSALLPANTAQTAAISYVDGTTPRTNSWKFTTGSFVTLPASLAVTPDTSKPGFKFNIFANSKNAGNNQGFNNDQRDFAEQSLNMIYNDWSDESANPLPLLPNLADVTKAGTADGAAAALPANNAPAEFVISKTAIFDATHTPGLPATDASTDGANGELLTYVSLPAGLTTFNVSQSDLYRVYFGSWDYTTGLLAAHLNVYGPFATAFYVVAQAAGVYPMRFVWNHANGNDPVLLIYTVDTNGNQHLLNDTANGGVATYRALATPTEPYIKFTSPSPVLRQLAYPSYALVVNIADGDLGVDDTSPVLTLDGKTITVKTTRVGDVLSLKYAPTTLQVPNEIHTATLAFKDKKGKALSETWSFMNFKAIWLPANPVTGENFDEYPGDGTVFNTPSNAWSTNWSNPVQPSASSWYVYSYTHRETDASGAFIPEDLTNPISDSYMSFVVAPISTFQMIEGDVVNVNPQETLNGNPVTTLGANNFLICESDNRSGAIMAGQEFFAYSKAFDLSTVTNPVVVWDSMYKQNQDNPGSVEYSVDGGTNWAPVIYYLDGGSYKSDPPDVFINPDGTMDAVTCFTHPQGDAPIWTDWYGNTKGGSYGDCLAAPITQALGPFVAPRINDDKYEGKRIEAVRLPLAANKKDVRLRFGYLGTCSWYMGVDNIGFYDIEPSGATVPTGVETPSNTGPAYAIGLHFGADEPSNSNASTLAATNLAGATGYAQSNWNNLKLKAGTNSTLVADVEGTSTPVPTIVTWSANGTWSTTGRGEENNKFTGADKTLMTGYLDMTAANQTTTITISEIPEQLTTNGYDVLVYSYGSVGGRGGSYRILDAENGDVLKDYVRAQSATNATTYIEIPDTPSGTNKVWTFGTHIRFKGLVSQNIKIQATTVAPWGYDHGPTGSTQRAPIDAVQLVPTTSAVEPVIESFTHNSDGSLTVTWSGGGTLQAASAVNGPWQDVTGATSPYNFKPTGSPLFGRIKK
jgi:hypothetical protein